MSRSASTKILPLIGLTAALSFGCNPTPDYRVTLHDIPSDTAVLLIAWKSDDGTVSKTSLAVPVADLSEEQRATYVLGVNLGDIPEAGGVLSVATIDRAECITEVASAEDAPRSSGGHVTQLELSLDPNQNPNAVQRAIVPSPPVSCPVMPMLGPYPPPVACNKLPGLVGVPKEPTLVPTRPVIINVLRQLRGQARIVDGGKLSFFGWGFDRPKLGFGVVCDPTDCFKSLITDYPDFVASLSTLASLDYQSFLTQTSYSEVDLEVTKLKSALKVDPSSNFQDRVVLCIATSALSFSLTNPDGVQVNYAEPLPRK